MRQIHKAVVAIAISLLAAFSITAIAQSSDNARFLSLSPDGGLPIIPILEGWIANPDGTTSFSFGIVNRNEHAVEIPIGENNFITPAKYSGLQPSYFPSGRSTGVFAITVPSSEQNDDVWWHLIAEDGADLKVPGRRGQDAYELDFILARPQGSLQPLVGVGERGAQSAGLYLVGEHPGKVTVGSRAELVVNVSDPSMRDPSDPRFGELLPVGVHFTKYQGPGDVEFTRHPSSTVPVNPYKPGSPRFNFFSEPGPGDSEVPGGSGVARIYATFSEPGEYLIRTQVENFTAPDSSKGDQCCWTNVIMKVNVSR